MTSSLMSDPFTKSIATEKITINQWTTPKPPGCNALEERFERIDSRLVLEKLQAEKKNDERVSPVVKKIIRQPDLPEKLAKLLNDGNIGTNRHLLS